MSVRGDPAALTNDVFISYSHKDDEPWGAGEHRWVTEFHHSLLTRLGMLLGRDAVIFRDDKIKGYDELTDRIAAELRQSRLFICVLSPGYLRSEWCTREIQLFIDEAFGPSGGAPGRCLFKVIKTPIERREQPQRIIDQLGYEFFRETPAGKIREFYPTRDENNEESREFWSKVDGLAQEIRDFLKATADETGAVFTGGSGARRAARTDADKTVYLAQTTRDVKPAREKIQKELGQRGFRVVPTKDLPASADELMRELEADLGDACLTVHPVGGRYGFIPEGDHRSIVELQIEAAVRKNGRASHVVWISPEAAPSEEARHQEFLDRLRHVYTEQHGMELLERKSLEDLKTRLIEKLSAPKPAANAQQASRRIYLICERADLEAVKPLQEYLRGQGFGVQAPLMEGEEQEIREDHQDTLVLCDAVLIYYGSARQAWLRAKLRDFWKAPGWGRTKPFLAQAVLVAPPASPDKSDYADSTTDEFLVLRGDGGPEGLAPFVAKIRDRESRTT
jgi:hypothetical protein